MNKTKIRLNKIFPQAGLSGNGPFAYMYNAIQQRPEWLSNLETALQLDRVFMGRFGRQIISPLLEQYLIDGEMTAQAAQMLSGDIYAIHAEQWKRKYALLSLEYNPISNYDMTETESVSAEKSGETSQESTDGGYTETTQSATGTISDTVTESGSATRDKVYAGTETETLVKSGTETRETAYTGTKTNVLERVGAERTIESWASNQTATTTESGTETEERSVYGFNSDSDEPANRTERSFDGRQTSTVTTLPEHTTETAQRDRNDTQRETFTDRRDTETDTFNGRTDTNTKGFSGRTDTETESFNNRQTQKITDDSGHRTTERTDNNLTESVSGTQSETATTSRTLERSGNIGVTTSQQMAQSEIALWQWNFYYDVFADVRRELTIGGY